ncbi:FAD-dependent monooxygenase [Mesorhizobium sp. ANAO-SY3R2]|uniref:FAD-dependent monooxygenase n=1 Tax=Mesorhizobium sp. ANAO-SY3R2 TaxID=3166644 RepID=UPI00366B0909
MQSQQIVVSGAGIAGLTAAIAFSDLGFRVRVYDRSPVLEEVGAGLQLSPNATRILDRLGVLDIVRPSAVQPEAVVLRDAATLNERARVPLGAAADQRWKAPYLVAHRADLQNALLRRARESALIEITLGATVIDAEVQPDGVAVSVEQAGFTSEVEGMLFVAADGVWSNSRHLVGPDGKSRFTGELAWRTTISSDSDIGRHFVALCSPTVVTTFLHSGFHLVAYPVRAGAAINLVAFTPGVAIAEQWSGTTDAGALRHAMAGTAPELLRIVDEAAPWTVWPLHTADASHPWTRDGSIALIGDAAHAMTPFAAQGAAMAIEDAWTLANAVAAASDRPKALAEWEAVRKQRVARVARRGALNHLAWHATGPVALARNMFLKLKSPNSLAADLDWLYGWMPPGWTDEERL